MCCQHSSSLEQHESKIVMVEFLFFLVETGIWTSIIHSLWFPTAQLLYQNTTIHSFSQAVLISSTLIFQYPAVLNDSYQLSIHICLNVVSLIISLGAKMAADSCFFRNTFGKNDSHCGKIKGGYRACSKEYAIFFSFSDSKQLIKWLFPALLFVIAF